jgi:hypothetical protein
MAKYKAILKHNVLTVNLVAPSAVFAAFQVALVQQKAALHCLPTGPSAAKGRSAQLSNWP